MEDTRVIARAQLESASKERLDELCSAYGTTQIEVMSRLVAWFIGQNQVVQIGVLGLVSEELLADFAERVLQELHGRNAPQGAECVGETIS